MKEIAKKIREILENRRKEICLSFIEDGHKYYMQNKNGDIVDTYPSVSTVEKLFYDEFDFEKKALEKCNGDVKKQETLLSEWAQLGVIASNKGSRVHFELEKYAINKFGMNKDVRSPIFECSPEQIIEGDSMINAGIEFIDLMKNRGCYLIDTEIVLGDPDLGYVGQPDDVWVTMIKGEPSIIITDHKTNKPENFIIKPYNDFLKYPFNEYRSYALTHYYLQLPLYFRLIKKMLYGSEYQDIKLAGCIIDSLRSDGTFVEYRIPKNFYDKILEIDISKLIQSTQCSIL